MKTALYAAVVVRAYRQALDDYWEDPERYRAKLSFYQEEIAKCTYRQFTTGFFFGKTTHESQIYDSNTYTQGSVYLGIVEEVTEDGQIIFEQKNKFSVGDTIEIMKTDSTNLTVTVQEMVNQYGEQVKDCPHPAERIRMRVDAEVQSGEIMRMGKTEEQVEKQTGKQTGKQE